MTLGKTRTIAVLLVLIFCFVEFNSINAVKLRDVFFDENMAEGIISSPNITTDAFNPDGSFHYQVNFTLQIVFIGYSAVINESALEALLPANLVTLSEDAELGFTQEYVIDYEFVYATESYAAALSSVVANNYRYTNTSKLNETALEQQVIDGKARSIFLAQEGYAINGTAIDDWLAEHPYTAAPANGYSMQVLNLSNYDSADHSVEHWFEFDDKNIDSNATIDWFRLEWDNELNPEVKFPYPCFDSRHGKSFIIDPSAHHWFRKWFAIWFQGGLPADPYSYITNDLDDLQAKVDLSDPSNSPILADYFYQWFQSIIDLMFRAPSIHGTDAFDEAESISVQVLVLNGDDYLNRPVEDIEWVTSEARVYEQLNEAMPYFNWELDFVYANLSQYPIIQQSFENNLVENVSNHWIIDGAKIWDDLYNRRYQFFDLQAADVVITATIIIRSEMTMHYGGLNFTGLGGSQNVIVLKSRERYFEADGITPKCGITDVLIHEIGHCLGFGHPAGASAYSRGTMTYYNTRHLFNWFYKTGLRRSMVDIKYLKASVAFLEDKRRFGLGPFITQINSLLEEIGTLLEETIVAYNQMNYFSALSLVSEAQQKLAELKVFRDMTFGKMRLMGNESIGLTEALFIAGEIAYVTSGQRLLLLDISNPSMPVLISSVGIPAYAMDVQVAGSYAYLALIQYGFCIIDVTDTLHPRVVFYDSEAGFITDVFVSGDILYTASKAAESYNGGVRLYNISNPTKPILVNHLQPHYEVTRVTVANNIVYMALREETTSGIVSVNVSNPHQGIFLGSWFDPVKTYTLDLVIIGNRLYVCQFPNPTANFLVIDISNSSDLTLLDSCQIDDPLLGAYITTSSAYLVGYNKGLITLSLSDLGVQSIFQTPGYSWGIAVKSNFAFVADLAGILVIDVSAATNPEKVGSYLTSPASINALAVSGDLVYLADQLNEIVVMNISDPYHPTKVGNYSCSAGVIDLQVQGNYLYATTYNDQFIILDLSVPESPVIIGYYNATNIASFSVLGDYAFIATSGEFIILDLTTKTAPTLVGSCVSSTYSDFVYVTGDYVILTCWTEGVQIIDITTLTNPTIVSSLNLWKNTFAAVVVKDNFVLVGHEEGISTLDITNPAMPVVVANYSACKGRPMELKVKDDLLFVANYEEGFHLYNLSNPSRLVEVGYNESLVYVNDINYSRGLIIVANGRAGLWLYEHDLDNDSLFSYLEAQLGTNPFLWDTDGDGWSDYDEWRYGTDPLDPNDYPFQKNNLLISGIILGSTVATSGIMIAVILVGKKRRAAK